MVPAAMAFDLGVRRGADVEDHARTLEQPAEVGDDGRTRLGVGGVAVSGELAGARLDRHLQSGPEQGPQRPGHQRHPALTVLPLAGNGNFERCRPRHLGRFGHRG